MDATAAGISAPDGGTRVGLARRRRYRRQPTGKRIELVPRDIELFKLLARYRYLRSTTLFRFLGGRSENRFKKRLGDLYHEGRYLDRPPEQWQAFDARYAPAIYALGRRGYEVLAELGLLDGLEPAAVRRAGLGAGRQFAHALMVYDTLAEIELRTRARPGLRFVPWREIFERAPAAARAARNPMALPVTLTHRFRASGPSRRASFHLAPDAIFGIEYTMGQEQLYRFFALEAERSNRIAGGDLAQTSFLKKALAYLEIAESQAYRHRLGLPNLSVLVVAPSDARVQRMLDLLGELTQGQGSGLFLFRAVPVLGWPRQGPQSDTELLTAPWRRAGRDDFRIAAAGSPELP